MSFEDIVVYLIQYRYLIIIPLAIVEGPIVMVLCGFLLRLDFFSFWPLYGVLMLGDALADTIWYAVGYYWGRRFLLRFGKYFSVNDRAVARLETLFHRYSGRILFISKITMGFGFALVTLIVAGIARVRLREYAFYNLTGQFIWTLLLMGAGFFFGHFYAVIGKEFKMIALVAFVLMLAVVLVGAGRYLRNRFLTTPLP